MSAEPVTHPDARLRRLLLVESYAQDVVNAWVRLRREESEDAPYYDYPETLDKRDALDVDMELLQRALKGAMSGEE